MDTQNTAGQNADSACSHCGGWAKSGDRRCRHGLLCGKCSYELDVYSGVIGPISNDGYAPSEES
jgi:hypothetical protein